MSKRIGIGIVGAGIMGSAHAKTATEEPDTKVIGIADVVEERANSLAHETGATPFLDFRKMMEDDRIDAILVTTPDYLHKEPVIAAAEAGKHIWIEKPLATNLEDADEMMKAIRRARNAGAKVTVQFVTRWYPSYVAFYNVLKQGYVGEPIAVDFSISDRIDVPLGMWGGKDKTWIKYSTIADFLTCYEIDLIRWITGLEAKSVYAQSASKVLKFTPDYYKALVRFEKDFDAYFESNWILARSKPLLGEHFFNLICSKGTMQFTHPYTTFETHSVGGGEIFFNEETSINTLIEIQNKLKEEGIISRIIWESEKEWPYHRWKVKDKSCSLWIPAAGVTHEVKHHHGSQFKDFVNSILEKREPLIKAEDGYEAVKVVCAIKQSAIDGKILSI